MKELFLISALARPALPWSSDKIYDELVRQFERDDPTRTIVLVHKDIPLLNPGAVDTGLLFRNRWHVWVIKKAA